MTVTWCGSRRCGKACGLLRQCLDKFPGGPDNETKEPVDIPDGKTVLPSKYKVLTSMEELIHQFILVTEGRQRAAGRSLFLRRESERRTGFLH